MAGDTNLFGNDAKSRIADAIARAEARTSGEIVAVLAHASDNYRFVPLLWASSLALLLPWPLIAFTDWTVQAIYLLQVAVFAALALLFQIPALRFALVPRSIKHARAHRRAVEQFLAQNIHTTEGRTGVLIFVSVAEHFAELIADRGIDTKVPPGTWRGIVDGLTHEIANGRAAEGFVAAIEASGEHLARHFPPEQIDENELPNRLIVL